MYIPSMTPSHPGSVLIAGKKTGGGTEERNVSTQRSEGTSKMRLVRLG